MSELEKKLKEAIKKFGEGVEIEDINDETELVRDYNYDSIGIIQLIVELEEIFQIEIDDDSLELYKLSQYNELLKLIIEKVE